MHTVLYKTAFTNVFFTYKYNCKYDVKYRNSINDLYLCFYAIPEYLEIVVYLLPFPRRYTYS